jgi:hypothetical protein
MLTLDCRALWLVVVVCSYLSAVGCGVLGVDCHRRLSLTFSIVGAQLLHFVFSLHEAPNIKGLKKLRTTFVSELTYSSQ